MPVETVQHKIHIRRKKNELVFQNIARLWELHAKAQSHQDVLDGLHPWNAPIQLKFENTLPYFCIVIGIIISLTLFIDPSHGLLQICFLIGLGIVFFAAISIESSKPIDEVIAALEQRLVGFKYQLNYFKTPPHMQMPLQSHMLQTRLKQLFPLFDLGSIGNDFPLYASSIWSNTAGQEHPVLVFQYRYITEVTFRDKKGQQVQVKEIEQFLYGVFVFENSKFQGLALSSQQRKFDAPYQIPWQTSDILFNQKLKIFGSDQFQMARQLTPTNVLKLDHFFKQQDGTLMFHPEQHCLCFLGKKNLLQISAKKQDIQDISALRGHLRTFKLPYLEQLQSDITRLLKNSK